MFHDPLEMRAYEIACRIHEGQIDRDGRPHIDHVLAVTLPFHDVPTRVVALLHDVIEDDEDRSPEEMVEFLVVEEEIPADIVRSVVHLSRWPDESYDAYLDRLFASGDERAFRVKEVDASHNFRRCVAAGDRQRAKKYDRVRRRCVRAILDGWYGRPDDGRPDDVGETRS